MSTRSTSSGSAFALLLLGATLIGFSSVLVRLSGAEPATAAFWRMVTALPVLVIWAAAERRRVPPAHLRGAWLPYAAAAGLAFAADMIFTNVALRNTTIANTIVLVHLAPLFVVLAVWIVLGQRPTLRITGSLALAIAGAVLLVQSSRMTGGGEATTLGDLAAITASVFYAAFIMAVGRARQTAGTGVVSCVSTLTCGAACGLAAVALGETIWPQSLFSFAMLAIMGVVCHAIGQGLSAFALGTLSPSVTSVVLVYGVLVTVLSGWAVFGELPSLLQWLGGAAVMAAVVICRPR